MNEDEQSILATLAYYGALRWPLTAIELSERLIHRSEPMSLDQLCEVLERLQQQGRIRAESGLYVLGDAPIDIAEYRVRRQASSADKWHLMLECAWWLQMVPYVRMMSASGSLAMGSSSTESDWDMFVIVQSGRLYTARAGLLLMAWLLGRLRTKKMRVAPDRFCFNHLITTDGLSFRHRSIFTAHAMAWLTVFYDPWQYASRLRQANAWVGEYSSNTGGTRFVRRELARSRLLTAVRWVGEAILNTFVGTLIERALRRWMRGRIRSNPETHRAGGRITADDRELEFHPRSFEVTALARYNAILRSLGLGHLTAHDSGLTH